MHFRKVFKKFYSFSLMKLSLNSVTCIGCGLCSDICGETFGMKDGKAILKKKICDDGGREKEAIISCPTNAISVSK